MPASQRYRVCAELIAQATPTAWSHRNLVYGEGCGLNQDCIERNRGQWQDLPAVLTRAYVDCIAGNDGVGDYGVDWSPTAPYAYSFPGLPPRQPAPATSTTPAPRSPAPAAKQRTP